MVHKSLLRLERLKDRFGPAFAQRKLADLRQLARTRLRTAREVERLHEVASFIRAWPDDRRVLDAARRVLAGFDRRADLRRHRDALAHTGIAGTTHWFPFFFPTAAWLVSRWPNQLRFDRADAKAGETLAQFLPALLPPFEAATLRESKVTGYAAIDRVRSPDETDAAFLVRRVLAMPGTAATREAVYDAINPSCELLPGADTPSRTRAEYAGAPLAFQTADLPRGRPDLRASCARAPVATRVLGVREGSSLLDLARGVMVTRQRDLDTFAHGDPREVLLVDDGGGLAFSFNGIAPEWRPPIAALFGGLTLQNGVPIGYMQLDCVGSTVALSYNTLETFRGGASAHLFARVVAVLHHVFGARSISLDPYQLGDHNEEGLASGAWWFYFKLGFRPHDRATLALARAELERMRRRPAHRSSRATLLRLAQRHMFFSVDADEPAFLPPLERVGWRAAELLARHGGADRERTLAALVKEARARTGLRSLRGFSEDEKRAWTDWAPLVAMLPLERWPAHDPTSLVDLIRAKGGVSERPYLALFARHARLQRDLWNLAR